MNINELKNILNTFPNAKETSKESVLYFFAKYNNFKPPKIWTSNGVIYIFWDYFRDNSKIALGFDEDKVAWNYTNANGEIKEGVYSVKELLIKLSKPLLTVKDD